MCATTAKHLAVVAVNEDLDNAVAEAGLESFFFHFHSRAEASPLRFDLFDI